MREASAVVIFGPPGSGKSTQAALLSDTLAYEVVDTGRILRGVLYDPARQHDPVIAAERRRFDDGILLTPSFVVELVKDHLRELAEARVSCVIGGSPRTLGEAEAMMPELVAGYGADRVHGILLDVPEAVCIARNRVRATCAACGRPQLATPPAREMPKRCRACGGELFVRADADKAEVRVREYEERTLPAIAFVERMGIAVARVDGTQTPADVFGDILDVLDRSR